MAILERLSRATTDEASHVTAQPVRFRGDVVQRGVVSQTFGTHPRPRNRTEALDMWTSPYEL